MIMPVSVEKKLVMSKFERLFYGLLVFCALFFSIRYMIWWLKPAHIPSNVFPLPSGLQVSFNIFLFALLTFVVFIGYIIRFGTWFALWFMARPVLLKPPKGLRVAFLTCYVPSKEPLDLLEKTLTAMVAVDYPHDTWVLDEGNDEAVKTLCHTLGVKHFSRKGIRKYNQESGIFRTKTKAGNHNAWRDKHEKNYAIVAQIDMDHIPSPDYFAKTLGYFADPKVAVVGMPQIYQNTENWIARGAAEQSYFFHGPMQQGFYGCDMPFLIGTSHIYRTCAMNAIGGYAPTIVEDHLTGMRIYAKGYKGVFVPEILAQGEGPTNWVDYFNQQMRWSYGLFEILFQHTPKLLFTLRWRQKINYLLAQLFYFSGVAVLLGTVLTILYLSFGIHASSMSISEWFFYATPPFVIAQIIHVWSHRYNIDPENEPYFGLFGMFLGLGANIIYTLAFFKYLSRRKLRYMVTKKGTAAQNQRVPLSAFRVHLLIAAISLVALAASFIRDNDAVQLRFWALFTVVTLLGVSLSMYYDESSKWWRQRLERTIFRLAVQMATIIAVASVLVITYQYRTELVEAFKGQTTNVMVVNEPSGKVFPKTIGALVGLSLPSSGITNLPDDQNTSIIGIYQSWGDSNNQFNLAAAKQINAKGAIPLITWEPWQPIAGYNRDQKLTNQKDYRLLRISDGAFDGYIGRYAQAIKQYKKPVMIRFAHEMNGNWYPWGTLYNTPQDYVLAWRHVHDIFEVDGATNVTWVWAPNEVYDDSSNPTEKNLPLFYPGNEYVDWVGFSAFNWGGTYKHNVWRSPQSLFLPTTKALARFGKPIMIAETASVDAKNEANKAIWIAKAGQFTIDHKEIKAIIWFYTQDADIDWRFDSTKVGQQAFRKAFSDSYFSRN